MQSGQPLHELQHSLIDLNFNPDISYDGDEVTPEPI